MTRRTLVEITSREDASPLNQPRVDNRIHDRRVTQLTDELEVGGPERVVAAPEHMAGEPRTVHSEEVQRVQVEEEDRLAFRVGVNILTLVLIGLAAYLVWRNFFQ